MKEDIIRMAKEAGFYQTDDHGDDLWLCDWEELKRFFHMAQAAEREACARMAEAFHQHGYDFTGDLELHDAIRARGQE